MWKSWLHWQDYKKSTCLTAENTRIVSEKHVINFFKLKDKNLKPFQLLVAPQIPRYLLPSEIILIGSQQ